MRKEGGAGDGRSSVKRLGTMTPSIPEQNKVETDCAMTDQYLLQDAVGGHTDSVQEIAQCECLHMLKSSVQCGGGRFGKGPAAGMFGQSCGLSLLFSML